MLAALDAGAEDIEDQGDTWQVTRPPTELHAVRDALEAAGIAFTSTDLTMLPQQTRPARRTLGAAKSVLRVIDALEEHDDVQNVYANFDIPDGRPRIGHELAIASERRRTVRAATQRRARRPAPRSRRRR